MFYTAAQVHNQMTNKIFSSAVLACADAVYSETINRFAISSFVIHYFMLPTLLLNPITHECR